MSKLSVIGILGKLNKSNPLRYITNRSKNDKTKFCHILTPWSGFLAMGRRYTIATNLLSSVYSFVSIFSGSEKLHNCLKGICFNF